MDAKLTADETRRVAFEGMILRGTVGSTAHGLHLPDQDDRDEMGVTIESEWAALGLRRFEHHVERTQPEGARSGPGDLDLVVYSLRKFCRLALAGNPTVLLLLYAPEPLESTELGEELRELAPAFLSRELGARYLGYLRAQKERLLGVRGGLRVNRPELVVAHGFDTKYAMHVLRLAAQGRELLEQHRLTLPLPEPDRTAILAVREGRIEFDEVLAAIEVAEGELVDAYERTTLPDVPDSDRVEAWMIGAYLRSWSERH